MARVSLTLFFGLLCVACGGGGGSSSTQPQPSTPTPPPSAPTPPPEPELSRLEAFVFLNQATFGATESEAERLEAMGRASWIDEQMGLPPSLHLPALESKPPTQFPFQLQPERAGVWLEHALFAPDQLRQRVAFALSQIMVVSQQGALISAPRSLADYYDLLVMHAFGNFRELMEDVTLHPAMGVYLSMLGNRKPDPERSIRPDENYARELMQLFTVGLLELEPDGTVRRGSDGLAIPTYDQSIVEGFAHVFTGWHFANAPSFLEAQPTPFNQVQPMRLYPEYHDTGPKKLLSGVTLPAGQSGEANLTAALDNVFTHPNVGPFIAQRLIQRLVSSNPSPDYIRRVADTFDDNGEGVRGDLGAVVRAILLDTEAQTDPDSDTSGKLKEPLLRATQLWRAYDGFAANGNYALDNASFLFGQGPLQSPSVFNFFSPFHAPQGEIRDRGLLAPELEIATEFQNTLMTNLMALYIFVQNRQNPELTADQIAIDLGEEVALAGDIDALIDRIGEKLLGGAVSSSLRDEIAHMLDLVPASEPLGRAAEAVYLLTTSPEFVVQR